ncbi:Sacsin [Sesbania bispinosa]|nr:Sacsin [Sesbania bispinosa]
MDSLRVSSNRRGIWYGDDMDRSGKVRSIWNRLLLEDVVAPAFMHMLHGISMEEDGYHQVKPFFMMKIHQKQGPWFGSDGTGNASCAFAHFIV